MTENINKLYKKKYRIDTVRLKDWDYSSDAYYFITLCIDKKKCLLGTITNTNIELSKVGITAKTYLIAIPEHFKNARIDNFVIMPNHVHAIIIIENCRDTRSGVSKNKFSQNIPGSLPVIVQQYKSSVKWWCNNNGYSYFKWQRLYYEHIIPTEEELDNIREYVSTNILKWELDEYHYIKK